MGKFISNLRYLFSRSDFIRFGILVAMLAGGAFIELCTLGSIPVLIAIVTGEIAKYNLPSWLPSWVHDILDNLQLACLVFFGGFLCRLAYLWLMHYLQARIVCNRTIALCSRVYSAYARAPYRIFLLRNTSEVINAIFLESQRTIELLNESLNILRSAVVCTAISVMILWFEPLLAACSLVILGALAGSLMVHRARLFARQGEIENRNRENALKTTNESIGAVKETKIYGCQDYFTRELHYSLEKMGMSQARRDLNEKLFWPILEVIAILAMFSATYLTMNLRGCSVMALAPAMALVAVSLTRLRTFLTEIMLSMGKIMFGRAAFYHVCDILRELEPQAETGGDEDKPASFRQTLEFRNLSFRYDGSDHDSLAHLNFVLEPGKSYGIVGPTGAGKSTLLDILLGVLEPTEGAVLLDGTPLTDIRNGWQRQIGYVPQFIYLFDDTIRANVALGINDRDVDEKALAEALRAAQLTDFIASLKDGDRTKIGERGVRLSGGQRQRLGIARALYRNPAVLVFDEATSALDNETEAALTLAIESLRSSHTVIIVAHRLTTVRNCDLLLKLENGQLAATGSFQEIFPTL